MMQHQISTDWTPVDDSKTRLELAQTTSATPAGEPILALRNTFDVDHPPMFGTAAQFRALIDGPERSRVSRLLGT